MTDDETIILVTGEEVGAGRGSRRAMTLMSVQVGTGDMGRLDHVRWIGGATGAGKTSVTRRLAERFEVAVYDSDATIGTHAAELDAPGAPLLETFLRMGMDERWVRRDPEEMYRTFPWFHGEGFGLLIEDLLRLPVDEVTIVEGFRLLPQLVRPWLTDTRHAVWLMSPPGFRRDAFARRAGAEAFWMCTSDPALAMKNLLGRDRMFAANVAAATADNELDTMLIDGAHDVDTVVDALAARFDLIR